MTILKIMHKTLGEINVDKQTIFLKASESVLREEKNISIQKGVFSYKKGLVLNKKDPCDSTCKSQQKS